LPLLVGSTLINHFEPDCWKKDELYDEKHKRYERKRYKTPMKSPHIYIPVFPLEERSPIVLYRLPVVGPALNDLKKATFVAGKVKDIICNLKANFKGCGWFSGNPHICIVADQKEPNEEIEIVEPGKEHDHVLPCSSSQLWKWVQDGSVKSGKVLLYQSRYDPDRYFTNEVESFSLYQDILSRLNHAEIIVCWCNNASTNSPSSAKYLLRELKEMNLPKKIQVKVLDHGINGFEQYMTEIGLSNKCTIR
jgi:hypothetical protein